jgi:AcrR family transcriptional regulator
MSQPPPPVLAGTRAARSRAAVLAAAVELLIEGGPPAVTVDAVVARSGVAKTTIYRHWSTRDELLVATFTQLLPELPEVDASLPFEPALRAHMREIVGRLADPKWRRAVAALLAWRLHHDELDHLEKEVAARQQAVTDAVLQRGIDEGALDGDIDTTEARLQLTGPLLSAALIGDATPDERLADRFIDLFLASRRP